MNRPDFQKATRMSPPIEPRTPDVFLTEILAQPDAIRAAGRGLAEQVPALESLRAARTASGGAPVVLTGMGSSFDAVQALGSSLTRAGVAVSVVHTAELLHFGLQALLPRTVVVAVSQSGRSAELMALEQALQQHGDAHLVSVTNGLQTPLARAARTRLDICAGQEDGPSTKTFAATMVVLAAVRATLTGTDPVPAIAADTRRLAERAADAMAGSLADPAATTARLRAWADGHQALFLLGRGVSLAAAELGALVIKEAARLPAQSLDCAEFRHGPLELAGRSLAVVVVLLEPLTRPLDDRLVGELLGRGVRVAAVGHPPLAPQALGFPVPAIDPLLDVAVAATPVLLLAWTLAQDRHLIPGTFQIGSKVTTRQ